MEGLGDLVPPVQFGDPVLVDQSVGHGCVRGGVGPIQTVEIRCEHEVAAPVDLVRVAHDDVLAAQERVPRANDDVVVGRKLFADIVQLILHKVRVVLYLFRVLLLRVVGFVQP